MNQEGGVASLDSQQVSMANHGKMVDVSKLLPLLGDMVKVLYTKKGGDVLVQSCDSAVTIVSSFHSSSRDLHASIEDCQKKINACNREIEKVKSESVPDDELVRIQKELEEMKKAEELLLQELNATAKLEELGHQRISVEEKKNNNSQKEKNMVKSKKVLSMCASVTNIVPNLYEQDMISGYILDKDKKRMETFEFESADFDACNQLWQMLSK